MRFDGRTWLDLGQVFEVRQTLPFTIECWMRPEAPGGPIFSQIDSEHGSRGFDVRVSDGRIVVRLVDQWPTRAVQVATTERLQTDHWYHLSVTFNGQAQPGGIYVAINGVGQDLSIDRQGDVTRIRNQAPFLIGRSNTTNLHGTLDEIRFYKWALPQYALKELPNRGLQSLLAQTTSANDSNNIATQTLRDIFLYTTHAPAIDARRAFHSLKRERELFEQTLPRVRVMREVTPRRKTNVLVRGDFRNLGEAVSPGPPSVLPPMQATEAEPNRLNLAHWLVRENKQHTASVIANRLWAQFWGRGIVATLDDFGVNGASPSHPRLLDWLRDELLQKDWDIKSLVRTIVLSETYRRSSAASSASRIADPQNELLTRGPRYRMSAEAVRDQALAVSGLLSDKIGGPSVRPYQPEGLWRAMSKGDEQDKQYQLDHDESLYRRGIYTFWKRSIHYPMFAILDAPNREVCTSERAVTNTPTQALVLLNDPTFIEAAKHFGLRIANSAVDFRSRIRFAFREAISRKPTDEEVEILQRMYRRTREEFSNEPNSAIELLQVGQRVTDSAELEITQEAAIDRATWTILAQTILTLDEAITKE